MTTDRIPLAILCPAMVLQFSYIKYIGWFLELVIHLIISHKERGFFVDIKD